MPARRYIFTPAIETRMRLVWAQGKRVRTAGLDALVRDTGWPRYIFKYHAIQLGITVERRSTWTAEQDKELLMYLGERSTRWIAATMRRTSVSIQCRAMHLELSAKIREGYTRREISKILGAPWHRVNAWIEAGWLGDRAQLSDVGSRVNDDALVRFVYTHMEEIDFRLADQVFLKGVFRDGKRPRISKSRDAGPARGGKQKRHYTRRAAGHVQRPLAFARPDAGDGERAEVVGKENACFAATA